MGEVVELMRCLGSENVRSDDRFQREVDTPCAGWKRLVTWTDRTQSMGCYGMVTWEQTKIWERVAVGCNGGNEWL